LHSKVFISVPTNPNFAKILLIKTNNLDQPELFFKKSILDLTWLGFEGS
jgi:hypothetical protein